MSPWLQDLVSSDAALAALVELLRRIVEEVLARHRAAPSEEPAKHKDYR